MSNCKSHIYGTGYGSSHVWENIKTRQLPFPSDRLRKKTTYKCRICGEKFSHYYGIMPNIFFALESQLVSDKCCKNISL